MKKPSQKQKVLEILRQNGKIDNFFCIETKLTIRLGAIIYSLQKEKEIELDKDKSGYLPETKNWCYVIKPLFPKSTTIYYHPETHEEITRKVVW